MSAATTLEYQSMIDVAIQEYGSVENLIDIINLNTTLDFSKEYAAGQQVVTDIEDKGIVKVKSIYRTTKHKVVNSRHDSTLLSAPCGIGCMIIENTFIVD